MLHIVNSGSEREVQKTKRREKIRFASIPSDAYLYTRGVHRYLAHRRMSKLRLARESEFLPRVCTLQKESDGGSDGREARVEWRGWWVQNVGKLSRENKYGTGFIRLTIRKSSSGRASIRARARLACRRNRSDDLPPKKMKKRSDSTFQVYLFYSVWVTPVHEGEKAGRGEGRLWSHRPWATNSSDGRKSLWTWHPYTGRYIGISN